MTTLETEKQIQENVIKLANLHWWGKLLYHVPNEQKLIRKAKNVHAYAKSLHNAGCKAGIPDLFLMIATERHAGLYIELKRKKGVLTKAQAAFEEVAKKCGYDFVCLRDAQETIEYIKSYINNMSDFKYRQLKRYVCESDNAFFYNSKM